MRFFRDKMRSIFGQDRCRACGQCLLRTPSGLLTCTNPQCGVTLVVHVRGPLTDEELDALIRRANEEGYALPELPPNPNYVPPDEDDPPKSSAWFTPQQLRHVRQVVNYPGPRRSSGGNF